MDKREDSGGRSKRQFDLIVSLDDQADHPNNLNVDEDNHERIQIMEDESMNHQGTGNRGSGDVIGGGARVFRNSDRNLIETNSNAGLGVNEMNRRSSLGATDNSNLINQREMPRNPYQASLIGNTDNIDSEIRNTQNISHERVSCNMNILGQGNIRDLSVLNSGSMSHGTIMLGQGESVGGTSTRNLPLSNHGTNTNVLDPSGTIVVSNSESDGTMLNNRQVLGLNVGELRRGPVISNRRYGSGGQGGAVSGAGTEWPLHINHGGMMNQRDMMRPDSSGTIVVSNSESDGTMLNDRQVLGQNVGELRRGPVISNRRYGSGGQGGAVSGAGTEWPLHINHGGMMNQRDMMRPDSVMHFSFDPLPGIPFLPVTGYLCGAGIEQALHYHGGMMNQRDMMRPDSMFFSFNPRPGIPFLPVTGYLSVVGTPMLMYNQPRRNISVHQQHVGIGGWSDPNMVVRSSMRQIEQMVHYRGSVGAQTAHVDPTRNNAHGDRRGSTTMTVHSREEHIVGTTQPTPPQDASNTERDRNRETYHDQGSTSKRARR